MNELAEAPFLAFLEAGIAKGGFETDDVLAALLPLMKQVQAAHEAGLVAPLDGIKHLTIAEQVFDAPAYRHTAGFQGPPYPRMSIKGLVCRASGSSAMRP